MAPPPIDAGPPGGSRDAAPDDAVLDDAAVPPHLEPARIETMELETTGLETTGLEKVAAADVSGERIRRRRWSAAELGRLADGLAEGGARLASLMSTKPGRERMLDAWAATVEAFRDPESLERRRLAAPLARRCRLSPAGLDAALEAVLGGVSRPAAEALIAAAARRSEPVPSSPALVILASNLPALAVQPLLPALALGRPVLLKSPSAEPLFAPAFVAALTRRLPALGEAVAAVTWAGGDGALEAPLLERAGVVLAYGDAEAVASLEARAAGPVVPYGPRTSLAALGAGADLDAAARGVARDVALFDQRGCLSVAAVFVEEGSGGGEPAEAKEDRSRAFADRLAAALTERARAWPPGPAPLDAAARVAQIRATADLLGLYRPDLEAPAGTVIVDPAPARNGTGFEPTPGLRTVRVVPVPDLARLPDLLTPWAGRLQGVALAMEGEGATRRRLLIQGLEALGVSRITPPGDLQSPDALWHNGGVPPLEALGRGGDDEPD